ncbi:histidinol dehydrogenase [Pseudaminobacter sp. 19-2017]|uniref:Histidinol dehydrogenase n=1 Tax=Pseudaminobacter soli (ex Zhang et al. 2022) TaxID=2831468 RepID=A0A942E7J9_9HYPH|nr:histidinol dehydrogenase [Pseudaminobacter soli]MBS3649887.1 histidinol dehydrogenase [Pseudaminobacter soli]
MRSDDSGTKAERPAKRVDQKTDRNSGALLERISPALALADNLGPGDPDFDMKRFTDQMWDET